MAEIIDGQRIAGEFCDHIRDKVQEIKKAGIEPCIALVNASQDPSSEIYVSRKMKMAKYVGITSLVHRFNSDATGNDVADLIGKLNDDDRIHAILLQSPLPQNFVFRELVNLIRPDKDVDGLTTLNQGRLFSGEPGIIPCTPMGVMHLLNIVHPQLAGMHAVVLGRSSIVGRPLAQLLLNADCTVTMLHSRSKNMAEICRSADVLVSAIGRPRFVLKNFIRPGATVIDVGVNKIEENGARKIVGDVDFDGVFGIAGAITPVPKGVGPMTVAYLMHNTLKLAYCY
ncbi:MAG: bifunctional methylenetetrahydrofolate dehydrogenase/methenyltetrahydrofolate cyclohydrolase [Holosporaceae bacterium]|jgi:methylenetetrahydrofolate dehydrogenase (NADP+)/methenyltetrahydrofolate cyclohydrolase|nr:bifunctional methylenetetrahydrofolate dehydrogenase/methenyltetrahydrofolate cyclohydrolase [Holosporaceae bacterium]